MTYQAERAREMNAENGRCFELSKVRIGPDGHIGDVLRGQVDTGKNGWATAEVVVSALPAPEA